MIAQVKLSWVHIATGCLPLALAAPQTPVEKDYGGIEPQVVAAWQKAGAEFVWFCERRSISVLSMFSERPAGKTVVPGFYLQWPPSGGLKMLPAPMVPFGLSLQFWQVTDADVNEIAAFKQLQALHLYKA